MVRRRLCALLWAAAAAGAVCAPAATVTGEYADTLLTLPQVSVTAIKSGELQLEAEASTTLGHKEIERLNIVNIKQASEIAPNFYMPQYGSRMTSSVYVRGLGTRIDQPVVGLNVDNVPVINKDNFDFDMADITRIEILRGPQNILYGRNTMGGLVNITTLSPLSYEGVRFVGEYGSRNSYRTSAGVYKRLAPQLGMALSLMAHGTDGFFRNALNNSRVGKERLYFGRWKTAWRPSARTIVENVATISHSQQHGYPYQSVATGQIAYNDTCFYRRLTVTDGLTVNTRVGEVDLSAIGSFQYINDNMTLDQDFLPLDYFTLTQARHEWAFTADVVARGRGGERYRWLAGAFGFARRGHMNAPVTFYDYGLTTLIEQNANKLNQDYPIRWDERNLLLDSRFITPSQGVSLYHESSLTFGRWLLTLGVRWDMEHTSLRYRSRSASTYTIYDMTDPANPSVYGNRRIDIDDTGSLSKTYNQILPKLTAAYTLPGTAGSVYASVVKGYKSGGYNTQMFSDVLQQRIMGRLGLSERYDVDRIISYSPEKTWNYEVGTHLSFPSIGLQLDAAAFWIDCRDQQLTMFPEGSVTGRVMANAGRSRSVGAEIAATASVGNHLTLRASYGYTNAKFRRFSNGKTDFSGCYVPYAPENTLFLGATWTQPFARSSIVDRITATVAARGVGRIRWDEANMLSQPFYMIMDASVRADRGEFSADIWADNITSTRYSTFYFKSIGNAFLQRGNLFACGVTLRWAFSFN